MSATPTHHEFRAEVSALLNLVTNSLYTHSEIFLRELISNASDALDKARFEALVDDSLRDQSAAQEIHITADKKAKRLIIEDFGIGMSSDECVQYLGTIAHSGTLKYLKQAQEEGKKADLNLIGQFGVGFYSSFMVAHRVVVDTFSARQGSEPVRWTSQGSGAYSLEPSDRKIRGTRIELHLKDEAEEFLEGHRIEGIIRRYSNYVMHPIRLVTIDQEGKSSVEEDQEPKQINSASAIWAKSAKDLSEDDYQEFYKHVMGGFVLPGDEPLARMHLTLDAPIQFHALLFVPGRAPADLFMEDRKALQLFARRVMVDDNCDKLLPQYLRFFRGVVDSEDLPLNVSREMLQDNNKLAAIRRQVTRKALKLLAETASERASDYEKLWNEFGPVLKEGLHTDGGHRDELTALLRYKTIAKGDDWQSLAAYVEAMPDDQDAIYFIAGENESALRSSPHVESLRAKGYDVLLMTDAVDEWVLQSLGEFEGKKLHSVTQGELSPTKAQDDESQEDSADEPSEIDTLLEKAREVLGDRVGKVRASKRLTESASCLVDQAGGLSRNMQRILQMAQRGEGPAIPATTRILELNPKHEFVLAAQAALAKDANDPRIGNWIEILHDLAGLSEGQVSDPAGVVKRLQTLLGQAAKA